MITRAKLLDTFYFYLSLMKTLLSALLVLIYSSIQAQVNHNDFTAGATTMPAYSMLGQAPFTITGNVTNVGSDTVTFFTINYKINGGSVVSGNINSVNIVPYATYTFSHPVSWFPLSTGSYSIDIWASNLNGTNDQDTTNDHFIFNVDVVDTFVTRNTCIEVFTGYWCASCHWGDLSFNNYVVPNLNHYTLIKYHVGPDVCATWEGYNRSLYYGVYGIPHYRFDGEYEYTPYSPVFNNHQSIPSFMTINISSAVYFDTTVYVSGTIMPLADYDTGAYHYQIVVTEKESSSHPNGMGDSIYDNVEVSMSPSEIGTPIPALTAGSPITFTHAIPIRSMLVHSMADLKVVVFVQNDNDKKIRQSAWRDISLSSSVVQVNGANEGMSIYPNPSKDKINIQFACENSHSGILSVFNMWGERIIEEKNILISGENFFTINVSKIPAGVYFIQVDSNSGKFYSRFMKQE